MSQVGQGQSRLLGEPQGYYTEGRGSWEPLIHFFHAGGILITFQWGDLIRDSSTGLFRSDLVFINA